MPKTKIALLLGGDSGEREISLKTGNKIFEHLDKSRYQIFKYDPKFDLIQFIKDAEKKKFDLVLPALHGPNGEDGKIQGLLELLKIPFVFSGSLASALAMDKDKTKTIVAKEGIVVPESRVITKKDKITKNKLGYPVIVKPLELGSSVGMTFAQNPEELKKGIKEALKFDSRVLLEKYIKGRELTVPILENPESQALPVIEIKPKKSKWFDFEAKYTAGACEEICPAPIPDNVRKKVQSLALLTYRAIGCKDLARADFIWDDKKNEFYFLEINTIPGMTDTSLVPQSARVAGISFSKLLDILIQNSLKNY